jgi:hypothetical protein
MEVRRRILRSLAVIALPCALALSAGQARADTPPEPLQPALEQQPQAIPDPLQPQAIPDPLAPTGPPPESVVAPEAGPPVMPDGGDAALGGETPQAGPEPGGGPEPTGGPEQQPAGQPDQPPQPHSHPAPAPGQASAPPPPTGLPNSISVPTPGDAPDPPPWVRTRPAPPPRGHAKAEPESRLLSRVDIRLQRVEESMRRVKRELDAGRTPADRSLRELRRNVAALAPALGALERNVAARTSSELDIEGVQRRLRRVLARAAVLAAALARAKIDTPESARLVRVLDRFTGVASTEPVPSGPSPSHVGRGAVDASANSHARPAYTHAGAPPAQLGSEVAGKDPYQAVTFSRLVRHQSAAPSTRSVMTVGGSGAASDVSALSLAAVALLVAVALSGSLSSVVISDWCVNPSRPRPAPDRRKAGRRTSAGKPQTRVAEAAAPALSRAARSTPSRPSRAA